MTRYGSFSDIYYANALDPNTSYQASPRNSQIVLSAFLRGQDHPQYFSRKDIRLHPRVRGPIGVVFA